MVQAIAHEGLLPFKYIVADCLYGNSPDFLDAVEACRGGTACVAIPLDTRCWLHRPSIEERTYMYKGEAHSKRVVSRDQSPRTVAALATELPITRWYRRTVAEGTKGPIPYEFARQRGTLCKDGLPERTVWLVLKRTLGAAPSYTAYSSNAPVSTPLSRFVWLSGLRWAMEQCVEESKTELGMDPYEVRKYPGWHHHMLTTMLAHCFLWQLKRGLGEKSACVDCVPAPGDLGSRVTAPRLYDCRSSGADRVGATASSPRLSLASQAVRGRGLNKVTL